MFIIATLEVKVDMHKMHIEEAYSEPNVSFLIETAGGGETLIRNVV